ncbi:MAG: hypothetical protein GY810_21180 [Aureispira sp.]|nr:hypothetical protein [Aureispira sp.]
MALDIDMGLLLEQNGYSETYQKEFREKLEVINVVLQQNGYPLHQELEGLEHKGLEGDRLGSYSGAGRRLERLKRFAVFIAREQRLPINNEEVEGHVGWVSETEKLSITKDSIRHFEQVRHLLVFGIDTVYVPIEFDQVFSLSLADGSRFTVASGVWVAKICESLCALMTLNEKDFWTYQDFFEQQEGEPFAGYSYFITEFPEFYDWGYGISNTIRNCAQQSVDYSVAFTIS